MRVVRSGHFDRQVAAELDLAGRPSVSQFEDQLAPIAELILSAFWDDPTLVPTADEESGIRITLITPPAPYMFPPSVFYARRLDEETIEMIGVDFDWGYWDLVGEDPAD
jgi:hypothetical protein